MSFTSEQRKNLHRALSDAFPTTIALTRVVDFQLDENLATIAPNEANLADIVFILIRWAISQGRMADLLKGVLAENPTNSLLRAVVEKLAVETGIELNVVDADTDTPLSIEERLQGVLQAHYERQQADEAARMRLPNPALFFNRDAQLPAALDREIIITESPSIDNLIVSASQSLSYSGVLGFTQTDLKFYDKEVTNYLADYRNYLTQYYAWRDWSNRSCELILYVINSGTAPAEGVLVQLRLPTGVQNVSAPKKSRRPRRPDPPTLFGSFAPPYLVAGLMNNAVPLPEVSRPLAPNDVPAKGL